MKKIFFLVSIFFISCTGQIDPIIDDSFPIPPELIGKWKIVEIYETNGVCVYPCWRDYISNNKYHVRFKEDNTYETIDGDPTCLTGTYTVSKDNLLKYSSSCGGEQEVYIELLQNDSLIIDLKIFEPHKLKYVKISE
ncbi:MAG: lipocalin family protein [Bacteroidales bacterium]|nr:lipocalin family protein [Bacteroidales bacterium]